MNTNAPILLGIDVGGTNLRLGVFQDKALRWENRVPARFSDLFSGANSPEIATRRLLDLLVRAIEGALKHEPRIAAIGLGFPGFIDPHSNRLSQSPNMPGLKDLDLVAPLQKHFKLPVQLENDALAAAHGEHVLAAVNSLIFIGLGTGVGGGLIVNGRPFPGEHGVAMEIGHLIIHPQGRICGCGNRGCLEQYASATGVQRSYTESRPGEDLHADQVAKLALQGDSDALAAFELAGDSLGQGLAHILKVVDVETVIIGGGLSQAWDLFYPALRKRLEADLIPALRGRIAILASQSEDRAGILGAAMLAGRQLGAAETPV